MNNSYLVPDIINDLLSKMINAIGQNEKQAYELQVRTIRDACNTALITSSKPNQSYKKQQRKRA